MLSDCRISGFADEINKDFDIQLSVLKELGQEYVELRSADGTGVADLSLEMASELREDESGWYPCFFCGITDRKD